MKRDWTSQLLRAGMAFFCMVVGSAGLQAVTIEFTESTYTVRPGGTMDIVVNISETIPNGLEGYAIKLEFLTDVLSVNRIDVVPGLDFDLFDPDADRDAGPGFASIAGFVEFGQPAYTGTDFMVFNVTIAQSAQTGQSTLDLMPLLAEAINFVDGLGNPLDETITFGTAILDVLPPWPPQFIEDLRVDLEAGSAVIRFTGTPERPYAILYSTSLQQGSWIALDTIIAPQGGLVEVIDPDHSGRRFYRIATP